jgi:hypothetical protein
MFDPCRQCARLRSVASGLGFGLPHASNEQVLATSVQSRNVRKDWYGAISWRRSGPAKEVALVATDIFVPRKLEQDRAPVVTWGNNPPAIPTGAASQGFRAGRFPNAARTTASREAPSAHETAGS